MCQTKKRRELFKNISVEVPRDFYARLEEKAKQKGVSKSDIVRSAVRQYLAQE